MVNRLAAEHSDNLGLPQDVALSYLHLSALQSDPEGAGPADPEGAQLSAIHAQRLLSRVVSRHPSDLNTRYLLALSYLRMGDAYFVGKEYQGAKDAYSESLQRFQTLSELGDRWRVLVRTDPPASQLTPYLIEQTNTPGNRLRSPSPLRAIWLLGRISALIGDTDRARETYLAGLSAFPIPVERPQDELLIEIAHANLLQGVGDCYASKNDFTQARAFYARAERIFEGLHAPSLAAERDRQSLLARLRDRVAVLGQHD